MKTVTPQELGLQASFTLPKRRDWRIGLIGLGGISHAHIPAYRSQGWQIVAAADIDPARRETARQEWDITRLYEQFEDVVYDPEVEVVSLLTHPTLREPVLRACVEAGKPLQTEKPLAGSLDEAERMIALAGSRGLPFAVSQNYRWFPTVFFARQIIERGWIGRPYLASIEIFGTQDVDLAGNAFYAGCGDFLTVQWNTHLTDLLRGFVGLDARRVFTRTSRMAGQNFASDNLLFSLVDFGPGCAGHILHTELLRSRRSSDACRIEGDRGTLLFPLWGDRIEAHCPDQDPEPLELDLRATPLPSSFCGPMGDFLAAVEEGREPTISARRNLPTLRQVLAEQRSAEAGGAWIELD